MALPSWTIMTCHRYIGSGTCWPGVAAAAAAAASVQDRHNEMVLSCTTYVLGKTATNPVDGELFRTQLKRVSAVQVAHLHYLFVYNCQWEMAYQVPGMKYQWYKVFGQR